jgi:acetoacetyl-CoA synthetase
MTIEGVTEGTVLWTPSLQRTAAANVTQFLAWLHTHRGLDLTDYHALWTWSVHDLETFWECIWQYFDVQASAPYTTVLSTRRMPGAAWFPGAELNYAQHVLRNRPADGIALVFESEVCPLTEITWGQLTRQVAAVATGLRALGVGQGDRVVAYMPNIPETVVAFLAVASLGAIWACSSPDFGTASVIDRFSQIAPTVLFTVDGYRYGGKDFDRRDAVRDIRAALPTLAHTMLVPYLDPGAQMEHCTPWQHLVASGGELAYAHVPFGHPLWVVYSSGTTGLPKPLVHSHGGILLEMLKFLGFHGDVKAGDRFFWFSTTGWIMWNILQGSLLHGATAVLFDGNPGYPDCRRLWRFAQDARCTFVGTSAPFLLACLQAGIAPGTEYDLSRVTGIGSTGAPLPPEGFAWVYEHVGRDLWLTSASGGTDIASGFVGGVPTLPVCAGELQCRCLGVKAEAFDEAGQSLAGEVGELVITEPMPSMPIALWNDADGRRYHESYFEMYPGLWRHGDWIRLTDRGSCVIEGRSDSTLKRMGVRMGSGDFYRIIETMPEVSESLIVGLDLPGGTYWMPLFVVLQPGVVLDAVLVDTITHRIRTALSPRHVPDAVLAIDAVPRTLNGKKLEVPVKKVLLGWSLAKAVNLGSVANPHALQCFVDLAQHVEAGSIGSSRR